MRIWKCLLMTRLTFTATIYFEFEPRTRHYPARWFLCPSNVIEPCKSILFSLLQLADLSMQTREIAPFDSYECFDVFNSAFMNAFDTINPRNDSGNAACGRAYIWFACSLSGGGLWAKRASSTRRTSNCDARTEAGMQRKKRAMNNVFSPPVWQLLLRIFHLFACYSFTAPTKLFVCVFWRAKLPDKKKKSNARVLWNTKQRFSLDRPAAAANSLIGSHTHNAHGNDENLQVFMTCWEILNL